MGETKTNQIVQQNDPFNLTDRQFYVVEVGRTAFEVMKAVDYDVEIYDLVVARNNEIVDCDFVIEETDIIMFMAVPKGGGGGGKQIMSMVAMIAIMVVAPYLGAMALGLGTLGGATIAGAYALGGLGASALFGGVMIGTMVIGGMLVQSLFKPKLPELQGGSAFGSFENSPTYGWNVSGNSIQQGGAVPVLYGKHKIVPQYIGKNLTMIGDKQYLSVLTALCEGPIDNVFDIQINDNPLSNYTSVFTETRNGTNDQTLIPLWTSTWTDQNVGKKLTNTTDWQYSTTRGDGVTELCVGIVCPVGIYYANDSGGLNEHMVIIDIEYRKKGDALWSQLSNSNQFINTTYFYVSQTTIPETVYNNFGVASTIYRPSPTGPFDVHKRYYRATGTKSGETITEFVTTVANLPIDATGQSLWSGSTYAWSVSRNEPTSFLEIKGSQNSPLRRTYLMSGLPAGQYDVRARYFQTPTTGGRYGGDVTFEYLQEGIGDDFTYPNTALLSVKALATDQLSGGMPKVSCIVERTTGAYGRLDNPAWACLDLLMNGRYGAGIPLNRINFQSFQDWADYCDQENFTVNIYLDQTMNLVQSLNLIGQNGRGSVMQYGSSFTALVDRPNLIPTQGFLFSMGNIIQNSFNESFLPLKDRANVIELSYYDEKEGYVRTAVELSVGNYDLVSTVSKTQIDLVGCTNREQALRQAKYHINQNRYLTITATWEASIDAIQCQVGDIVNVAHDVPQWGYSGRILGNTANTITVDRNDIVIEQNKHYYIQVSDANTDIQHYLKVVSISDNVLRLVDPLAVTFGEYSVYSFGEVNRHAKKMRILSITTAGDFKRKISAIEYNDDVYLDTVTIPAPIFVGDLYLNDIKVFDYIRLTTSGQIETVASLSWRGSDLTYKIEYENITKGTSKIFVSDVRTNGAEISGLIDGDMYKFYVNGESITHTIVGKSDIPDAVTNLTGYESAGDYVLHWTYLVKPIDFSHFSILKDGVEIGQTTDTKYSAFYTSTKSKTFGVAVIDTTGNSSTITSIILNVTVLNDVTGLKSYYSNETTVLTWDKVPDQRVGVDYEIRMGTIWENANIIGRTSVPQYTVSSNGTYLIKAHYQYDNGVDFYSVTPASLIIDGAVLPKNIVATYDEKATGWLGTKTNLFVNIDGDLELLSENIDLMPIIDDLPLFDYAGGIKPTGVYEIPPEHIIDIGTAQQCRIWTDYSVAGIVRNERVDAVFDFDAWLNLDGYSSAYAVVPQIAIAQNDGIFGAWENFVVGDYVGRKFKFRGLFYSYDPFTTCVLSRAIFFVDMPDKLQSANGVSVPTIGTHVTYPIPFQVPPNNQITITSAIAGDDIILTNETNTGFDVTITNGGVGVLRTINWLAKGY